MKAPAAVAMTARRALLLRRFPYGESSLVLHLLTPEAGRVALLAKGAYRPSSGYFAVFDLFDTLHLRWSTRPGQDLGLVTRARLESRRARISTDLERYRVALGLLELAHVTGREGHEERALFGWLEGALDLLQAGRAAPGLVALHADLGLLARNGLAPALDACASCGTRAPAAAGPVPVSVPLGGRLCAACAAAARARGQAPRSLPLNVLRVADSLMGIAPARLENTRVEERLLAHVREFVGAFLEYHLETRLRSRTPRRG